MRPTLPAVALVRAVAERDQASVLLQALMDVPAGRRLSAASENRRFATLGLAIRLLAAPPYSLSPERAIEHAHLALAITSQLDPERYPAGLLFDVVARAWARIAGNRARRGAVPQAEEALALAVLAANEGTGDPLGEAHLLEHAAAVRRRQRRHLEARRLLRRARELYLEVGESAAAAALGSVSIVSARSS